MGTDTDQRDVLNHRLRDDQAVERVFVVNRQCGQSGGVARLDREDMEPVVVDGPPKEILVRQRQSLFFHADLDRDLPVTRRADQFLVRRFENQARGTCAEAGVVQGEPEERVGIKQ